MHDLQNRFCCLFFKVYPVVLVGFSWVCLRARGFYFFLGGGVTFAFLSRPSLFSNSKTEEMRKTRAGVGNKAAGTAAWGAVGSPEWRGRHPTAERESQVRSGSGGGRGECPPPP